jgi:hypothetical protein
MFYSETLLQKSGPLARVWLSANLERKLSKTHILQSNLVDSVEAIITPSQAPMALRLSGQLLLGVVRIYSRKARYLLDDCNEVLMKVKMVGFSHVPANGTFTDCCRPSDQVEITTFPPICRCTVKTTLCFRIELLPMTISIYHRCPMLPGSCLK